jgi:putative ABC transport system permease protein
MNLWESVQVALEGLAANKLRSALTMLGVIIGVFAVIAMLAIAEGARTSMMSNIQSMGTDVVMIFAGGGGHGGGPARGGFGSVQSLALEDAYAIAKQCPSVLKVAPEAGSSAQVKFRNQNTNTQVLGTTADYPSVRSYKVTDGRFFSTSEVRASQKVAVIGYDTAKELFDQMTPVGKDVRIKGVRFRIIGVLAQKGSQGGFGNPDDQILIPITTAMRRLFGLEYVRMISAQATASDTLLAASDEITQLLRKRHRLTANSEEDDFRIMTQTEFMAFANQAAGIFTFLLGGVAALSLLVGGIGIMNIMLVSVTERTREIGIRMALGARRRDILLQFVVESVVLSLAGGAIGVLLGLLLVAMAGAFAQETLGSTPIVSLSSILLSFGFSAFVGIFFGIYPAQKAARLDPIDALRYE